MKNQVTSIEQSKLLLELGVPAEKASMVYVDNADTPTFRMELVSAGISLEEMVDDGHEYTPAFTVADLLGMMPGLIDDCNALFIERRQVVCSGSEWCIGYKDRVTLWIDSKCTTLSDICALGIEWLLSNGYKLEL